MTSPEASSAERLLDAGKGLEALQAVQGLLEGTPVESVPTTAQTYAHPFG